MKEIPIHFSTPMVQAILQGRRVPPTDPYLLRRITKNIFAVEAQWDLTPLEKAAMAGRMH